MEKSVLQAEFPDLPCMQIDSGGYTGLTHGGVPIGLIVICGSTRRNRQALSQKAEGGSRPRHSIKSARQSLI
jgi:hypothetical protein